MDVKELRERRRAAGISGFDLSSNVEGMSRSRLSEIERGVAKPREGELERLSKALDRLIKAKRKVASYARREGFRSSPLAS